MKGPRTRRALPCPACRARAWAPLFTAPEIFDGRLFDLVTCPTCGLGQTLGVPRSAAGRAALNAPFGGGDAGSRFRPLLEPLARHLRRRRLRSVLQLRRDAGRILDVGCGRAVMLGALVERGWDGLGIELDGRVAATARNALGSRIRVGPFNAVDLGRRRFDVVTFWHSLEHLTDPRRALTRARARLAPDGAILVAVPNIASWQARLGGPAWLHLDPPRHRWHFTPSTLARLAARAGLAVDRMEHFSLEYGPFGAWQTALYRLGFGHTLFARVLRPGSGRPIWREPALWAHLAASGVLLPLAGLAFPFEALAAACGAGGSILATLRAAGRVER